METVRRRLEEAFEQAVWRQPSVVLLDDLDHMTGAAGSQEHERGPEAIRSLQLAQSRTQPVGFKIHSHPAYTSESWRDVIDLNWFLSSVLVFVLDSLIGFYA